VIVPYSIFLYIPSGRPQFRSSLSAIIDGGSPVGESVAFVIGRASGFSYAVPRRSPLIDGTTTSENEYGRGGGDIRGGFRVFHSPAFSRYVADTAADRRN